MMFPVVSTAHSEAGARQQAPGIAFSDPWKIIFDDLRVLGGDLRDEARLEGNCDQRSPTRPHVIGVFDQSTVSTVSAGRSVR